MLNILDSAIELGYVMSDELSMARDKFELSLKEEVDLCIRELIGKVESSQCEVIEVVPLATQDGLLEICYDDKFGYTFEQVIQGDQDTGDITIPVVNSLGEVVILKIII
jgi:hypothetical protein